jgi:uncharacterized membrane protein
LPVSSYGLTGETRRTTMLNLLPDPLPLIGQIITLILLVVALVTFVLWLFRFYRDYKDETRSALDTD